MDTSNKVITIRLNGEAKQIPSDTTVGALIAMLGLTGKRLALERNGDILPRSKFETQTLQENDKLEIVVAVGGG